MVVMKRKLIWNKVWIPIELKYIMFISIRPFYTLFASKKYNKNIFHLKLEFAEVCY